MRIIHGQEFFSTKAHEFFVRIIRGYNKEGSVFSIR